MIPVHLTPRFLDTEKGRIFALLRYPEVAVPRGCLLVAPPFAEEMNKTRRMLSLLTAALAECGVATLVVDPLGTGDSEGGFGDADWQGWQRDLLTAAAWSAGEGWTVNCLLGVRVGCSLAAEVARELPGIRATLFWQPVLDAGRMLDQFLRLRVIGAMMDNGGKETVAELRARLQAGEALEVAGYVLGPKLAAELTDVRLERQLGAHLGEVFWLEVVRSADAAPPTPAVRTANAAGIGLFSVPGEPFWSSVEIVTNPALIDRSAEFIRGIVGAPTFQ